MHNFSISYSCDTLADHQLYVEILFPCVLQCCSPNLSLFSIDLSTTNINGFFVKKQNAEDNDYPSDVVPSLEFLITSKDITRSGASSTLLIFNNERGFSATNIESICRVGKSTKKGNRHQGYIGEKGNLFTAYQFISL